MKKLAHPLKLLALSLAIALPLNAIASNKQGNCQIKDKNQDNLICHGNANLENTKFTGNVEIDGKATLKNVTINGNLTINGLSKISDLNVKGDTNLKGQAAIKHATFSNLTVHGALKLTKSTISGINTTYGSMIAAQTTFNQNVTVFSAHIAMKQSIVNGDLIVTSSQPATVNLSNGSIINGEVIFTQKSGTVMIKDTKSHINGIKNGSEIKHKPHQKSS